MEDSFPCCVEDCVECKREDEEECEVQGFVGLGWNVRLNLGGSAG